MTEFRYMLTRLGSGALTFTGHNLHRYLQCIWLRAAAAREYPLPLLELGLVPIADCAFTTEHRVSVTLTIAVLGTPAHQSIAKRVGLPGPRRLIELLTSALPLVQIW
jgi:hypothetical protein